MREPQRQISPWFQKLERIDVAMHSSRSASAKITFGFLPPSSSDSYLNFGAAAAATFAPVIVPPVNEIAATSSCSQRAAPAPGPVP
jgi:hypothetical protein